MYNIYENPWLLFSISMAVLLVIVMFRKARPEKARFWQLIIPFVLAATAFGVDHFVKTDYEKIELTIKQSVKAVIDGDLDLVAENISPDYSDQRNPSKQRLMEALREITSRAGIEKIKIRQNLIKTAKMTGSSELRIAVFMQPKSDFAPGKSLMFAKLKLHFRKTENKEWQIYTTELISINDDPLL
ncbi:MAG: hypothetical protein JW912_03965 [Sedimentisphaerales bacterium]|nr:hypothetical protein [Sedimentisphaerales bacterium]